MNFLKSLRSRRVPQWVSAYVVGGWGLVEFSTFLENRLALSPHIVNLVAVTLVMLIPSIVVIAWCHGETGRQKLQRLEKITVPINLIVVVVMLGVLFANKDLGAATETVEVQDENGAVTQRVMPKNEFLKRVLVYYVDGVNETADAWLKTTPPFLLLMDLVQDPFVDAQLPQHMVPNIRDAGYDDAFDLPRALQRKIARDMFLDYFLTWTVSFEDDLFTADLVLNGSANGKVVSRISLSNTDLFQLIDELSIKIRRDLGVPSGYIDEHEDLPVSEIVSTELETVQAHATGIYQAFFKNHWPEATESMKRAVEIDPTCALSQYFLHLCHAIQGDTDESTVAVNEAMKYLYRVPERSQLDIKAQYYFNVENDPEKTMAVIEMWLRLYPQDLAAYGRKLLFQTLMARYEDAIATSEQLLELNPNLAEIQIGIGELHQLLGNYEQAEQVYNRYIENLPTKSEGYIHLSDLYEEFGELDKATAALDEVLLLEPGNFEVQMSQIDLLIKEGKAADCLTKLKAMLADGFDSRTKEVAVHDKLVTVSKFAGRYAEARQHLDKWFELGAEVNDPTTLILLYAIELDVYSRAGESEAAIAWVEESMEKLQPPVNTMVWIGRIPALITLGRLDQARSEVDAIDTVVKQLNVEAWRPRLYRCYGQIAEAENDIETAAEQYEKALEKRETNYTIMCDLARCYRVLGQVEKAEGHITRALELAPGNPGSNLEAAYLYRKIGKPAQAREHIKKAVSVWEHADSTFAKAAEARQLFSELVNVQ